MIRKIFARFREMGEKLRLLQNRYVMPRNRPPKIVATEMSNIVQIDDMGYPLVLFILSNGNQQWIDVGVEWARERIKDGRLVELKWLPLPLK